LTQVNGRGGDSTLALHGVGAALERIPERGRRATGGALIEQCAAFRVDLLVMGAYGHAQAAETILGGAARSLLDRPPCAILMSH
jgi:nucleotide-binding universal stress UspA family protein